MAKLIRIRRLDEPKDKFGWFNKGSKLFEYPGRYKERITTQLASFKYCFEYYEDDKLVSLRYVSYLPPPYLTGGLSMVHSITTKVAEMIKESGKDRVEADVVEALVDRTIKKQADAMVQALDKLASMENDYKKIDKPDIIMKDADDKEISAAYSPARNKERKEAREKIGKLERAIEKAYEKGDYSELYNLVSGKQSSNPSDKGKGEGEAE